MRVMPWCACWTVVAELNGNIQPHKPCSFSRATSNSRPLKSFMTFHCQHRGSNAYVNSASKTEIATTIFSKKSGTPSIRETRNDRQHQPQCTQSQYRFGIHLLADINAVQNGIVIDYSNGDQQFIITKVTNLLGKSHSNISQKIPEMIAMSAINTGARG